VRLFPRTGSYLIDSMLLVLRAILCTLGVCLVIGVSALLVRATLALTDPYASTRVSSLLALLVFVVYVGLPTYLLATRTDLPGDERKSAPEPDSGSAGRAGTPAAVDEPTAPDEAAANAGGSDAGESDAGRSDMDQSDVADSRDGDPADQGSASDETGAA
jgi:hypothetical protein